MIVLPNAEQHPDIQKLNLNVAKLEEATTEVLSSFFTDKDAPNNIKKKPYLKEIFLLAKYEERFRNGEIGRHSLPPTALSFHSFHIHSANPLQMVPPTCTS